jgi:hypothetical protein
VSAAGALPGFTYPALAYPESEFLLERPPRTTGIAVSPFFFTLSRGQHGFSKYVSTVQTFFATSAAVGTRTIDLVTLDPDGNFMSAFRTPVTINPGGSWALIWDASLSTSYTLANNGYSPMQSVILLPGFTLSLEVFNADAGDVFSQTSVTGVQIPTTGEPAAPARLTQAPLIT